MGAIRTFWRNNRIAVAMFFALALGVKLLVPQGYMFDRAEGTRYLTVQLCFDGITHKTARIEIPGKGRAAERPDQHCAFASLAMAALGPDALSAAPLAVTPLPSREAPPVTGTWNGASASLPPPSRGPPDFV